MVVLYTFDKYEYKSIPCLYFYIFIYIIVFSTNIYNSIV